MADEEYDGEEGNQLVAGEDQHVDDSQLKLPEFDRAAFNTRVASGEEDEDVLYKVWVPAAASNTRTTRRAQEGLHNRAVGGVGRVHAPARSPGAVLSRTDLSRLHPLQ